MLKSETLAGAFDALLFDLDDTVVEFTRVRRNSFIRAAEHFRLPVDGAALYAAFCRESDLLWDGHRAGRVSLSEVRVNRFRTVLAGLPVDSEEFTEKFYEILSHDEEVMPGAVEATLALAKRYVLVGISNGRRAVQEERLRRVGLAAAFRIVLGPEDCGFAKPHPGLFELAMKKAGVAPGRAMVVGDGLETDIEGAVNLGLASCWLNPEGRILAPQDPKPTLVVKDLPELCRYLI